MAFASIRCCFLDVHGQYVADIIVERLVASAEPQLNRYAIPEHCLRTAIAVAANWEFHVRYL
jgi:hypothetical protein